MRQEGAAARIPAQSRARSAAPSRRLACPHTACIVNFRILLIHTLVCSILLENALFLRLFSRPPPCLFLPCLPASFDLRFALFVRPFTPFRSSSHFTDELVCYLCSSVCNPLFCSISPSPFGLIAPFDFLSPGFVATTDSLPAHSTPLLFVVRPEPRLSKNPNSRCKRVHSGGDTRLGWGAAG